MYIGTIKMIRPGKNGVRASAIGTRSFFDEDGKIMYSAPASCRHLIFDDEDYHHNNSDGGGDEHDASAAGDRDFCIQLDNSSWLATDHGQESYEDNSSCAPLNEPKALDSSPAFECHEGSNEDPLPKLTRRWLPAYSRFSAVNLRDPKLQLEYVRKFLPDDKDNREVRRETRMAVAKVPKVRPTIEKWLKKKAEATDGAAVLMEELMIALSEFGCMMGSMDEIPDVTRGNQKDIDLVELMRAKQNLIEICYSLEGQLFLLERTLEIAVTLQARGELVNSAGSHEERIIPPPIQKKRKPASIKKAGVSAGAKIRALPAPFLAEDDNESEELENEIREYLSGYNDKDTPITVVGCARTLMNNPDLTLDTLPEGFKEVFKKVMSSSACQDE
jgi:hypothetical protein